MKQTKTLTVILSFCMAFLFITACNDKKKEEPKAPEVKEAPKDAKMDTTPIKEKPTSPGNVVTPPPATN